MSNSRRQFWNTFITIFSIFFGGWWAAVVHDVSSTDIPLGLKAGVIAAIVIMMISFCVFHPVFGTVPSAPQVVCLILVDVVIFLFLDLASKNIVMSGFPWFAPAARLCIFFLIVLQFLVGLGFRGP